MKILRKTITKYDLYFLPVSLFLFFFVYHYYTFYINGFEYFFSRANPALNNYAFDKIQQFHPYEKLYFVSKTYVNPAIQIYFFEQKYSPKYYDYSSSYYQSKLSKEHRDVYLSEVQLMTNYFFYPRKIQVADLPNLEVTMLQKGDLIISNEPLFDSTLPTVQRKNIVYSNDEYNAINRVKQDSYYIYEVI